MAKLIFTPWKEQSELLAVRDQFYPPPSQDGPDMRANACATVGAWKIRGNLPHPVEATALLTDAILHDDATKNSIFSIRATYSAAFCRFVTGLVDSKLHGQKKTMFQKAIDLGLPASFVELRHEATHRELPSLVVLRSAAQRSLEWLWDYYWAKIDYSAVPALGPSDQINDIRPLQEAVRRCLDQIRQAEKSEPPRKKRKFQYDNFFTQQLISICKNHDQGAFALTKILLEENTLVPTERTLGASLDDVFSRWDPLLQTITDGHPSFLTILTDEMVHALASPSRSDLRTDPYVGGVYMWLDHILRSKTWKANRRHLSLHYILASCHDNPNHWTERLSKQLQKEPRDSDMLDIKISLKGRSAADDINMDATPQHDGSEALNAYGWEVSDSWNNKAMGVV
ncbi:hypothetical protein VTN00DRAFT_4169 [Thermoascus crustaceus]|uniref:uncharacterized protein n=1 Tax=Thermoascus crustaceus TaxID=5088 RepID=UPI003743DA2F